MTNAMNKTEALSILKSNVPRLVSSVNAALSGRNLTVLRPILRRIDSTGVEPHWFAELRQEKRLPNLDGKTVGSVIEKLAVSCIEHFLLGDKFRLSINPAKGIDVPELDLGIKSPSTNFCTSEPFYSAYDRLLGNECDALILLTNYQSAKNNAGHFNLKIIDARYLHGSEIADRKLCAIARNVRNVFVNDAPTLRTVVRFIAYVNQGDWEASALLKALEGALENDPIAQSVEQSIREGRQRNRKQKKPESRIPEEVFRRLSRILETTPHVAGLIRAIDTWVISEMADSARYPNDNELRRLLAGPLDGKIGMSFALQWRYNFASVFPGRKKGE